MPKIVNKDEKRREIAFSCIPHLSEVGIKKFTVAAAAKCAGIGKGTIYEYFENKDNIIFEIINIHIESHHERFLEDIKKVSTTKEKIKCFFSFLIEDSSENGKHLKGYQDYLSVALSADNESYKNFNSNCDSFFSDNLEKVINEAVEKNELLPIARNFIQSFLIFERGLTLSKMTNNDFDANKTYENYIDSLLEVLKVKHD